MSEAIFLVGESTLPTVRLHPMAVVNILNSFVRRSDRQARLIGTLMGIVREGNIEIVGKCTALFYSLLPSVQSCSYMIL